MQAVATSYSLSNAFRPYPRVWRRCRCHERPNGRTGHDHQYHGFNHGALGNVITLFGPQGMVHLSLRSEAPKIEHGLRYGMKIITIWELLKKKKKKSLEQVWYILTIVWSIHLVAQRKSVVSIKLGGIRRLMEHWLIKQIWEVASQEPLVCTISVLSPNS